MSKCYNTAVVSAPVDKVWEQISNFHDLGWAKGVIESLEPVGEKDGYTPGAERVLNGAIKETLVSVDSDLKTFSYSIDDGPGPLANDSVSDYLGTVTLRPITEDDTTFVEWESTYTSANVDAVSEFCNPIYHALLQALKKSF